MPDGSEWDVPAELVAENRANHYSRGERDTIYKTEFDETMNDHRELADWAANNMDWEDVRDKATLHKAGRVDYQEGWVNGDKTVVDI